VGMVQDEQAAIVALLRAKIAQLAVSAAEAAVRVRWLTWAVAREITSRRLRSSMSAVVEISLDPVEILLA